MPAAFTSRQRSSCSGQRFFGTASARWRFDGSILQYRGSGVITESVLRDMQGHCAALTSDCEVVVADHTAAVFAMTPQMIVGLALLFDTFGPRIEVPVAIVLSRRSLDLFRTYATEMPAHGISRAVFADADLAQAWARRWVPAQPDT